MSGQPTEPESSATPEEAAAPTRRRTIRAHGAVAPPPSEGDGPKCGCGFGLDHPWVTPQLRYSVLGFIQMGFGVTATPREVRYVCWQCDEIVHRSTERADRERHRLGSA